MTSTFSFKMAQKYFIDIQGYAKDFHPKEFHEKEKKLKSSTFRFRRRYFHFR